MADEREMTSQEALAALRPIEPVLRAFERLPKILRVLATAENRQRDAEQSLAGLAQQKLAAEAALAEQTRQHAAKVEEQRAEQHRLAQQTKDQEQTVRVDLARLAALVTEERTASDRKIAEATRRAADAQREAAAVATALEREHAARVLAQQQELAALEQQKKELEAFLAEHRRVVLALTGPAA